MEVVFEGWCCADCVSIVANGDATGLDYHLDEEDAAKKLAEIEAGMDSLVEGVPNGHLTMGREEDLEFSRLGCDVCGTHLAGSRHSIVVLGDEEPEEEEDGDPNDYETCAGCGFDHEYEPAEAQAWHEKNPE